MNQPPNEFPSRKLQLPLAPVPDNAIGLAETFREIVNPALNYTRESLAFVEVFIEQCRQSGKPVDEYAETLFCAGCYFGQVLARNLGTKWVLADQVLPGVPPGTVLMPMVQVAGANQLLDPIARAYQRFAHGDRYGLIDLYEHLAETTKP
jgi:hypothetical protein